MIRRRVYSRGQERMYIKGSRGYELYAISADGSHLEYADTVTRKVDAEKWLKFGDYDSGASVDDDV